MDVLTPALDGTILPGVTRASCIALLEAHVSRCITLPSIPTQLTVSEGLITIQDLHKWSSQGRLLELFAVGTAVTVHGIARIGFEDETEQYLKLPEIKDGAVGPVAHALLTKIRDIQGGRDNYNGWGVTCQ